MSAFASVAANEITAAQVHDTIARHMLADGFAFVLDIDASRGSQLVDARTGTSYLDLFTFFASSALGMNHPSLAGDAAFRDELARVAVNKPSNSDVYSVPMARFVETFVRVLGDPALPHLFFIEGGGLAVENALKVAFDWKSRWNEAHGIDPALGTRVLHLQNAFHGRTGYTMSLTNTDANKVARFPKFDWPRIPAPAINGTADVEAAELESLAAARAAFEAHPNDIACFIAEPIQGEGGDNHFRPQFLQSMQALCREFDALFVLDEVQTGVGLTGTAWAYQQLGVQPDVVAIIERDGLIARAAGLGEHLLGGLHALAAEHEIVRDVRGRGLMCAFTLPSAELRDALITGLREDEQVLVLGCGASSLRFRPALTVSAGELDRGLAAIGRVLDRLA